MNDNIVDLDNQKQKQQEEFEEKQKELEAKLNLKIIRKQQLESQVHDMTYKISDLNAARNTLHEKMSDQEKEILNLKSEKARLEKNR
jgi:chromosome segregation ATPase